MSDEKAAWIRLIQLGALAADELFSPSKAKQGLYTQLLKEELKRPLQVDEEGQPIAEQAMTLGEAIAELEERAAQLLKERVIQSHRSIHLRQAAADLGLNVRDGELKRVLSDARRRLLGTIEAIEDRPINLAPVPWLVEGLLMARCMNLIVAPPKVGKTSLALRMVSQWINGAGSYLGQRICAPCPPVLIVGPDMPECDWGLMLKNMGLLQSDLRLNPKLVAMFTAGNPLTLDDEGIERIAAYAAKHPGLLVILDSVHTATMRLGISENDPEIAQPLMALIEALEPHDATLLAIHHANKARMGEAPTMASRGSSAIPALASHMVGLSRLQQGPQSNGQSDRRVVLKTEGRGGMPLELLIERINEAEWICHGDAEAVHAERHRQDTEGKLSDRQLEALEQVRDRWELDGLPTDAMELGPLLGLSGATAERKARRTLDQLVVHGLVAMELQNTGVSRRKVYRPVGTPRGGVCPTVSELSGLSGPGSEKNGAIAEKPDGERDRTLRIDRTPQDTHPPRADTGVRTPPRRGVRTRAAEVIELPVSGLVGSGADVMDDGDDPTWGPRPEAI